MVTEFFCNSHGGTFQGAGTTCQPSPCGPPGGGVGACCVGHNGNYYCFMTTQANCAAHNGQFQGAGTQCMPNLCEPGDANNNGFVNVSDLILMINSWGMCPKAGDCPADFNSSGRVDVTDLLILLNNWS